MSNKDIHYQYREIICGLCKHRFVFNRTPGERGYREYYKKENGSIGIDTKCTECGKILVAFDNETTALPIELREDAEKIERHGYEEYDPSPLDPIRGRRIS